MYINKSNKAADRAALPDPSLAERGNAYDAIRGINGYPYLGNADSCDSAFDEISKTALSLAG